MANPNPNPRAPRPGDSQQSARPTHDMNMGIGDNNFQDVFGNHNHSGSPASGALLQGPYFITDSTGKLWKLVCSVNGALSTVKAH